MAIRWDQVWKQLTDWGGDYDIFDDKSYDGGVRDSNDKYFASGITKPDGSVVYGTSKNGVSKPGYDETGRLIVNSTVPDNPDYNKITPVDDGTTVVSDTENGGVTGGRVASPSRVSSLKAQSNSTLDDLMQLYDVILSKIKSASGDQTTRINGNYDQKVNDQGTAMSEGMYDVDAGAAAGNLADSSFRSSDRGKVRAATEANIRTLNEGRGSDLAEIGKMANTDMAKYQAEKDGISTTRQLLNDTNDESELSQTVNNLGVSRRGVVSDMAKYDPQGAFIASANKLGTYDTSKLESTLDSIVANASATPSTKTSTIKDIIDGTGLSDSEKNRIKSKYNQIIG